MTVINIHSGMRLIIWSVLICAIPLFLAIPFSLADQIINFSQPDSGKIINMSSSINFTSTAQQNRIVKVDFSDISKFVSSSIIEDTIAGYLRIPEFTKGLFATNNIFIENDKRLYFGTDNITGANSLMYESLGIWYFNMSTSGAMIFSGDYIDMASYVSAMTLPFIDGNVTANYLNGDGRGITGVCHNISDCPGSFDNSNIAYTNKTNIFIKNQTITGGLNIGGDINITKNIITNGNFTMLNSSNNAILGVPVTFGKNGYLTSVSVAPDAEIAQNVYITPSYKWYATSSNIGKLALYNGGLTFQIAQGTGGTSSTPALVPDANFCELIRLGYPFNDYSVELGDISHCSNGYSLFLRQDGTLNWNGGILASTYLNTNGNLYVNQNATIYNNLRINSSLVTESTLDVGGDIKAYMPRNPSSEWDNFYGYQAGEAGGYYAYDTIITYKAYAIDSSGTVNFGYQETSVYIDNLGMFENDNAFLEGVTLYGGDRFIILRSLDFRGTYPDFYDTGTGMADGFAFTDNGSMWVTGTFNFTPTLYNYTYLNHNDGGQHRWGLLTNQDVNITGNSIVNNLNVTGNFSAKRPYMMVSDNTTQTIPVALTAYVVNFSTIEDYYMMNLTGKQNFTFQQQGDYLIEVSAIVSVDTPNKHIEFWVQKTNASGVFVNIPRSNTKMELTASAAEIPLAVPFIIDVLNTDKIRFMMASDDAGSQFIYTTNTSYSPASPSIIVTFSKISEITI